MSAKKLTVTGLKLGSVRKKKVARDRKQRGIASEASRRVIESGFGNVNTKIRLCCKRRSNQPFPIYSNKTVRFRTQNASRGLIVCTGRDQDVSLMSPQCSAQGLELTIPNRPPENKIFTNMWKWVLLR